MSGAQLLPVQRKAVTIVPEVQGTRPCGPGSMQVPLTTRGMGVAVGVTWGVAVGVICVGVSVDVKVGVGVAV